MHACMRCTMLAALGPAAHMYERVHHRKEPAHTIENECRGRTLSKLSKTQAGERQHWVHAAGRSWRFSHLQGWQINLCNLHTGDLPNLSQCLQVTSTTISCTSAWDLPATEYAALRHLCTVNEPYTCSRAKTMGKVSDISLIELVISFMGTQWPRHQLCRSICVAI